MNAKDWIDITVTEPGHELSGIGSCAIQNVPYRGCKQGGQGNHVQT